MPQQLDLVVTLVPTMSHFASNAQDSRLSGIRINTAMIEGDELDAELAIVKSIHNPVPLYMDLKGRQLRIRKVIPCYKNGELDHFEFELNHRINVRCPTPVLFRGGEDHALLLEIRDFGTDQPQRLVFQKGGPRGIPPVGASICIRASSFQILDQTFPQYEVERIKKVASYGWTRYVLSYVESQRDIDEFREHVGPHAEVWAKIESRAGLNWVARNYTPQDNLRLLTARGDLYIEVASPHDILAAQRLIIEKDPLAIVGSRILLSLCQSPRPTPADIKELSWLYDIGYRTMMLCDDLCIQEEMLSRAISAFDEFRQRCVNKRNNLRSSISLAP